VQRRLLQPLAVALDDAVEARREYQDLGADSPGAARQVDLVVVHRAEVRMQYDAVVEEREAADAVDVRIHDARGLERRHLRGAEREREPGAVRLQWDEQRLALHDQRAAVAWLRAVDPVSAERQLDAPPWIARGQKPELVLVKFALVLVERLDLAALRIDDARVVRDERARRVSGQCA
jgi:hypothetical protein